MTSSTQREFKIGIVGCGRISHAYMQAIERCPAFRVSAVIDIRPEAVQAASEAAGCTAFTDLESFASDSTIDGAIVCAPPSEHRSISCTLLQAGIHVLCEKPFATSLEDAQAMVEMADEADRVLMMASKFRHVEDVIRAKAFITSGLLGQIQFYENRFCGKVDMRGRWNSDPKIGGGGVLIDNGTHSVDIIRYLLGPICRVHAEEATRVMSLPVEDTVCLCFATEDHVTGSIFLSWSTQIDQLGYINIFGTEGGLSIGWKESKYRHNSHGDWIQFGVGYDKIKAFESQVANFVGTVQGSTSPSVSAEDAVASVEVIEAAYRSMEVNGWQITGEKTFVPCAEEKVVVPCVALAK